MASIDIFNPTGGVKEDRKNTDQYRVSFKEGKNGIYRSVIRFIPWYADPSHCQMEKEVSWVKDPITHKGLYVDDPKSIGEFSPVTDMFFKFYHTGIPSYVEFAKTYLGSKKQYASLVQIMSDEQHPELVGQIKIWVYGKKVQEKLHNEEFPPSGQQGINPFHPIYGRKFSLICTNQSGFNNFDQSGFFDEKNGNQILPSGMWYVDPKNPNSYSIVDENTDQEVLVEYLKTNSPDLSKYDYHPWTEEQTAHVQSVLANCANFMASGTLASATPAPATQAPTQPFIPGSQPAQGAVPPPTSAPVFPGAAPAPGAVPSPAAAPVFPGATPPPAAAPVFPGATPPPAAAPMPTAAPVMPGVTGVTPPTVTPKSVDAPVAAPVSGMNMDDVLAKL